MRALPSLTVATAAILVAFVAWRARGGNDAFTATPPPSTGPKVEVAEGLPTDPEVQAASQALIEADAPASPAQARALTAAIAKLDALVERDRGNPEFLFYRGLAATLAADEAGSRGYLSRVATASPLRERDARFVLLKALVILTFESTKPDPALRLLRTLKAEVPSFMPEPVDRALHRALMQCSVQRSDPSRGDEAVALMEEAAALVRNDPRRLPMTRRMLALTYTRASRYPEAEEIWRSIVETTGGRNVDFVSGLANVLAMQNRWDDAIPYFTKVLELLDAGAVPTDAGVGEARLRRGNCYRLLGRLDEARADLERFLKEHPDDHRGVYWLGMLWFDGYEDAAKALPYLERAYRAAPWCESYGRTLVQLYEIRAPDPVKAAAIKREIEANAADNKKKLEAMARESRDGVPLCR